MADIDFRLGVASDALSPLLQTLDSQIDKINAKLQSFALGGYGAGTVGGTNGSTQSPPGASPAGSAAGVVQGAANATAPPMPPAYQPPPPPPGAWATPGVGSTAPSGFPGTSGSAAQQAAQGSAGINWAAYPNSPANPNAYGPAAPGSIGYNGFIVAQQAAQQQALSQRQLAYGVGAYIGVRSAAQGLELYAHSTASGDYDPLAGASLIGGMTGALAGGAAGALASPLEPGTGFAVGSLAGQMLGSAGLQAIVAPWVRQRNAEISLESIAARESVSITRLAGAQVGGEMNALFPKTDRFGRPQFESHSRHIAGELDSLQESISFSGKSLAQSIAIKMGIYAGRDIISLGQISETYSTLGSGLLAAGDDPDDALTMTDRLARKYFMGSPEMAARAARVAAIANQQGRNRTDMLLAVGPESYGAYTDATGESDLTPAQRSAFGAAQRDTYAARRAAAMVRGSGAAQETALTDAAHDIALLPGGVNSAAYAETQGARRDARSQRYAQADMPFNLRMASMEGEQARAQFMPYSPAFMPKMAVQAIGVLNNQIGVETGRYNHDLSAGDMTESDQLERFRRIEALRTERARDVGTLALGGEDRMVALSSNRPEFFSRMDSERLAQTMLLRGGNGWNRMHGAMNGQQLAMQQSWLKSAGGDDTAHALEPFSRTGDMNSSLAGKEITDLLREIRDSLKGGTTGSGMGAINGTRASEGRSNTAAILDTQGFDAQSLWQRAG